MNNTWLQNIFRDPEIGNIGKHLAKVISEKYANGDLIAKFYDTELAGRLNTVPNIICVGKYQLMSRKYLVPMAGSTGRPAYYMRFPKPVFIEEEEDAA